MQQKSIDGVSKQKRGARILVRVQHTSVKGPEVLSYTVQSAALPNKHGSRHSLLYVVTFLMLISFTLGSWAMWQSGISFAGDKSEAVNKATTPPGSLALEIGGDVAGAMTQIPNSEYFSMPLAQLEYYLTEGYKTPEMREAEIIAKREDNIRLYLEGKKSPLADIAGTLAALKHWRLVLAISNSESSLGRRCADNNCSGIGVEPGHALWRKYESKAEWAEDLDELIEKRYKDWSLEEMNGVYNYPGSENWLFAARQVLDEIKNIQ